MSHDNRGDGMLIRGIDDMVVDFDDEHWVVLVLSMVKVGWTGIITITWWYVVVDRAVWKKG